MKRQANPQISSYGAYALAHYEQTLREREELTPDLHRCFGYHMAESVRLHHLAHIMGHDSLDTTTLSIQGTRHDVQQAVETIAQT